MHRPGQPGGEHELRRCPDSVQQFHRDWRVPSPGDHVDVGSCIGMVGGPTGTLAATGGASGNPVVFSSSTTGVCTVAGSSVTYVGAGTCTVLATQAGNRTTPLPRPCRTGSRSPRGPRRSRGLRFRTGDARWIDGDPGRVGRSVGDPVGSQSHDRRLHRGRQRPDLRREQAPAPSRPTQAGNGAYSAASPVSYTVTRSPREAQTITWTSFPAPVTPREKNDQATLTVSAEHRDWRLPSPRRTTDSLHRGRQRP